VVRRRAFCGFSARVFHIKICVLCSSFDLLLLRYFVTSGIRVEDFKINPLSMRLSAALPGSISAAFSSWINVWTFAVSYNFTWIKSMICGS
jgi:hypothetical protein